MPRDDATGDGLPAPTLVGKARACAIQLPLHKMANKLSGPTTTPGKKKSQAGWGLSSSLRLLPVLQLWTPLVTAGHGRSSILRGAPGRALQAGRKAPPLSPPPRPHLDSAGGRARPAPGSSESGPPPYALRGPPAGLLACVAPLPEAVRPGGVVRGRSHPGGQGHCGPRTSFGISAGFTFSICVFLSSQSQGTETC